MKPDPRACTLSILVAILCCHAATVLADTHVRATGMSFFETGRELVAREKALDNARRAAVEQVAGALVESRTGVENARVFRDQILSRSAGYLKDMRVVEEKKTELGTYAVTIEAVVETAKMAGDLDRFQALLKWQKNPRVAVTVDPGTDSANRAAAAKAAGILTDQLNRSGFMVFRHSQSEEGRMGLLVALTVEHATTTSSYQGLELTLNEVSVSADIYQPGDNKILASAGAVKSVPGDNRLKVMDKAVQQCVEKMWLELSGELTRVWEKELYGVRDVLLVVKSVPSYEKALEIEAVLQSDVSGVAGASLVRFDRQTAEYDLQYRGWPEQLSSEIQTAHFRGSYFQSELENIKGNTLVIRINPL